LATVPPFRGCWTTAVEALNLTALPTVFVAFSSTIRYLPFIAAVTVRVFVVPVVTAQSAGRVSGAAA
jgi:hypothetical protein